MLTLVDYIDDIEAYIAEEQRVEGLLDRNKINEAINALVDASKRGAKIYVMGNGGSSATASHFVCDFAKGVYMGANLPFEMQCLSDNAPIITAISNDIGYEDVFVFQLKEKVNPGDLILAISGSGDSENVIRAAEYAKECGAVIVGMTGYSGGRLKRLSDYQLHVPVDNMQIVEDIHMMFDHLIMYVLCNYRED